MFERLLDFIAGAFSAPRHSQQLELQLAGGWF